MSNIMESDKNYAEMQVVSGMVLDPSFVQGGVVVPHLKVDPVAGLSQATQYSVDLDEALKMLLGQYDSYDLALDKSYFDEYVSVDLLSIEVPPTEFGVLAKVERGQVIANFEFMRITEHPFSFLAPESGYVFLRPHLGDNAEFHEFLLGFKSDAGLESVLYGDEIRSDNCDVCLLHPANNGALLAAGETLISLGAICESVNIVTVQELDVQDSGCVSDYLVFAMSADTRVFGQLFVPISPNDLVE